jgi:hypothetical protein
MKLAENNSKDYLQIYHLWYLQTKNNVNVLCNNPFSNSGGLVDLIASTKLQSLNFTKI